jgi:hypothetical protein
MTYPPESWPPASANLLFVIHTLAMDPSVGDEYGDGDGWFVVGDRLVSTLVRRVATCSAGRYAHIETKYERTEWLPLSGPAILLGRPPDRAPTHNGTLRPTPPRFMSGYQRLGVLWTLWGKIGPATALHMLRPLDAAVTAVVTALAPATLAHR